MADLAAIRDDLRAFGEAVGCPLTEWQTRALSLAVLVTVIVAPRQSGKSRSLALLALWWAYRRRGQRVLIVSAGEEASRRLLAMVRRIAAGSPLLAGSVLDEQAGLLTLSNGSEVRSVPASDRQVRGWAVDLLLVDEAALVSDDLLLGAAFPTTAARPEARIVMASSATTAAGAFYDHAVRGAQGSEHVRTHRWALTDCEWITPTMIAAARESMTDQRFAAEYEGQFASGADALFSRHALDRATADYRETPLEELRGPARLVAGIDWGAVNDRSALVAIGRLAGERTFAVSTAKRWQAGYPLPEVVAEIAGCEVPFDAIVAERNGLGEPMAQLLFRAMTERPRAIGGGRRPPRGVLVNAADLDAIVIGSKSPPAPAALPPGFHTTKAAIHTSTEQKAATYSALRLLIDQGRLVLPQSAEDLIRELILLRVALSPGGAERIEASSGHDDLADALALSLGPFRDHRGRWRTYVGDLADGRPLPGPALERMPHLDRVETGAGLAVPRTPIWQSVRGPEVTVPAGVDLRLRPQPAPPKHIAAAREHVREVLTEDPDNEEA